LEEILGALRSGAAGEGSANDDLKEHLAGCHQCSDVAEQYRGVMGKLDQYSKAGQSIRRIDCPPAETWVELAAGAASGKEAETSLEHAGECSACSARLKEALEIVGAGVAAPPELARDLKSGGSRWQSKVAEQMEKRSRGPQETGAGSRWLPGFSSRWAWAPIAAAVLVVVGAAAYLRFGLGFGQASPEKLLAQAYAQQRTIELRINQAPYGPIRVQRDRGSSQLNASSQLLEAEVAIKRRMVKQPENPDFLREKAEVDLLNWDYQPAIETLGHALRLQPQSFLIALDLGTAHFERAEATNSPADYEASLNYLGDAIRLEPGNSAALFNRAIVYERLYLYGRAIEDWEQFLKIEKDAGWRKEAEQRLQELRERERQRSQRPSPEKLTLSQFITDLKGGHAGAIEEYLEVAERQILPNISSASLRDREDQKYQATSALAAELESAHDDLFLKDMLRGASDKDFQPAAKLLGKSSTANHEGRSDEAYADAVQAAELFRRSGNEAGFVAAGFEEAYALQFQSKAASCEALAAKLVRTAFARSYVWLNIQLRLEQAICSNMNREVGPAKNLTQQALELAKEHGYESFYLRALTSMANLEYEAGNESNAWSAIHEGLGVYWKSSLPSVRAYSICALFARMAQHKNHPNVQLAAGSEALLFRSPDASRFVEASERARLGDAALRLGDLQSAERQFREAQQFFATLPQTNSVRWRELEVRLWLARAEALHGFDASKVEESLLSSLPEVERLTDRYLEFEYYDILAYLKVRSGDINAGQQLLLSAISIAEDGLQSLPTWRERLAWREQYRRPYVALAELLVQSGKSEPALDVWEHFRVGNPLPFSPVSSMRSKKFEVPRVAGQSRDLPSSKTGVVTYAFGDSGLMIWVRHTGETHAVYLHVRPQDLRRASENLIGECSRPDSDITNLHADARYLYKWLIFPIRHWLPTTGHIVVEPDGILGVAPFEVLLDDDGAYLGARYAITIASSVQAGDDLTGETPIRREDPALIAVAPAATDGSVTPASGAVNESLRVAARFSHPFMLVGGEVQVARVGRELPRTAVFHFAGHAGLSRSGAAMLMADGLLGADQARTLAGHGLSKLKLAVFSACGTARTSDISDSDSLVTTFLEAGAHNVLASRWSVDSIATSDFVDLFYGSLLSGANVAEAVQQAETSFRKTPDRAHPYYWAAFAAFGGA
jgi:CHAT domain-containing protein